MSDVIEKMRKHSHDAFQTHGIDPFKTAARVLIEDMREWEMKTFHPNKVGGQASTVAYRYAKSRGIE